MSLFRLERTAWADSDITCKACNTSYDVKWETEYSDPLIGDHETVCPECRAAIKFSVAITYTTR